MKFWKKKNEEHEYDAIYNYSKSIEQKLNDKIVDLDLKCIKLERELSKLKRTVSLDGNIYSIESIRQNNNVCTIVMFLYQNSEECRLVMETKYKNILTVKNVEHCGNKRFKITLYDNLTNFTYDRIIDFYDYNYVYIDKDGRNNFKKTEC